MPLSRRALLGALAAAPACAHMAWSQSISRPLPLLPLMDLTQGIEGRIDLKMATGTHDFGTGAMSQTFGINAGYLGPQIRVKDGQTLPFDVTNEIGDVTTLHWHGLHIPGDVDGGPHQEIAPGATWSPDVPIRQRAGMSWFHSHTHGKTAEQTYKGLAGVMVIEDDDSLAADLPKSYGVDDFTLVLQDKMFDAAGRMAYELTGEVFEEGFLGDTYTVNGALAPVHQAVPSGLLRLRLLNACNARFLTLSLETGPLAVIASDGGFLASTVLTETLTISPGERYEVLVDMRSAQSNALRVASSDVEEGTILGRLAGMFGSEPTPLLRLTGTARPGFDGAMPDVLAQIPTPDPSEATLTRTFELNMEGDADLAALALAWGNVCGDGVMGINGQPMNMDRVDAKVDQGRTELWRITEEEDLHPFHIHGCSFRILTQQGEAPPAYAQGWKDMVYVEDGWSEVLVRFDHLAPEAAPYMFHCHILEHEDCAMMGQFTVTAT